MWLLQVESQVQMGPTSRVRNVLCSEMPIFKRSDLPSYLPHAAGHERAAPDWEKVP